MANHVSNIPTQKEKKGNNTRISREILYKNRQKRVETTSPEGSQAFVYRIVPFWGHTMLARKNRISKSEFPSAKDRGVRFLSTFFSGTAYPTKGNSKFCVVVSKKIAKSAVKRNHIKRQFYAAVEPYVVKINKTIVLYPKKEALGIGFKDLQREIKRELEKTIGRP